ncbi:MAG: LuxR C-terminal-related transcriptional regulator [Pseudomonadota bacterium]
MDAGLNLIAGSLLRSALTPPRVPVDDLVRPQVQAALAAQPHARLLLFAAPLGFGKTSALAALAAARGAMGSHIAWLSLEAEDDEPARFFHGLIAALRQVIPGLAEDALGYLHNVMGVPVATVMESLLVDLARQDTPLLLVLDDVHLIRDGELLCALNRLVQRAPAGFTLAIGSRGQPALSLATLRAKDLLLEIGAEELRLTEDETRAYLDRSGLSLDAAALAALHRQTEGWMAGVHLASLWLRHQPEQNRSVTEMGTDQAAVGDYLLCSVFEQLSVERQELLLALGVASQLSGDLANALTGRQDGQGLLEELESLQLFLLPLDRERQWYRFHNLFADFLRARLKLRDPERFKQLHFNASLWFTNHHMQNLAMQHACLAEDPEMLAALVDGCGLQLINRGQLTQIYRWRQHVPDAIAERYPVLVLTDVWDKATGLALPQAYRLIDPLLARWGGTAAETPLNHNYLAALAIKATIALQKDDLEQCTRLACKVETLSGPHTAFLEAALLVIGALAHVVLGQGEQARRLLALAQQRKHFLEGGYLDMQLANVEIFLALEQGRLKQAQLSFDQLRVQLLPWFGGKSRALALTTLIDCLIAYQQTRLDGVEARLRWALGTVDVINPIDLYAQGMLCLARIQRLQNRPKEALASLLLMQNQAARTQTWRFYAQAVGEEIALILQETTADRFQRAEQRLKGVEWHKLAGTYAQTGFNPVLWVLGLTRIRLQQARGHYSEALHEITQLRSQLQKGWHGLHGLRLDLLAALSYQRLGYQERAQTLLVQCLLSAEREEARGLFLEEGEPIRLLLQQLEAAERQPALQVFIRGLLAAWPGQGIRKALELPQEGLTERECEVIGLAAKGLSNDDIGRQLALALGTVKWHLHNIYEKLKVRNRTQAIRRARELSLLES